METPNDIEVSSWNELIEELYLNSWQENIERYRSHYAFRGLSDKNYNLETTLIRLGGKYDDLEIHLLRNFIKYAKIENTFNYTIWSWLVIARHHGLPTRILDWTYSPFVALHFATANIEKYKSDGVIWCVDFVKMRDILPDEFREALIKEGSHVFTVEMLSKISPKFLQKFDKNSDENFALFFEPPSTDDRIINQFALHSTTSNPKTILTDILTKKPELYKRVIIPSSLKWEIRDKLDQANINERVMFPGLDGLCKWLERYYSPKRK